MFNKDKSKVSLTKRIIAFAMDYLLIALFCSLLSTVLPINTDYTNILVDQANLTVASREYLITEDNFDAIIEKLNKDIEKYEETKKANIVLDDYKEVKELLDVEELDKEKFTKEFSKLLEDKYVEKYDELSYTNMTSSVGITFLTVVVTLLYFTLCYTFMNGQTLAKRVMKLRVVSTNDKDIKWYRYLIRTGLISRSFGDIILYGLVILLSKQTFMNYYSLISDLVTITWLVVIGFAIWRLDGRGLHDVLCNTRVCKVGYENVQVKTNIIEAEVTEKEEVNDQEALVIEEPKEQKTTKRKPRTKKAKEEVKTKKVKKEVK